MTTQKREWTYTDIMGVMREIATMPQPERQSADWYTARMLLDARADLEAAKAENTRLYDELLKAHKRGGALEGELAEARILAKSFEIDAERSEAELATAKLEGAIEALEWAASQLADGDYDNDIHWLVPKRLAELLAEKAKLK